MRLKKYKTKQFSAVDYRSFGNGRKSRFHIFSFESFGSNYNPNRIKYKTYFENPGLNDVSVH